MAKTQSPKKELQSQLTEVNKLVQQADKFNEIFNSEIMSLKNTITRSKEREKRVQERIEEESLNNRNRQEEVEELISQIRNTYDRNVKRLKDHHKQQLIAVRSSQDSHSKDVNYYMEEQRMATIEIHSLQRKVETKMAIVDTLHLKINKNEKLITELEEKLCDEKENAKKHAQRVEVYRNELEEKKDELHEKTIELKRIKSEFEETERNHNDDRKNLESTRENEKKWRAKCTRMEERVETLLKEVEETKRVNATLTISVERKQTEIDRLKTDKTHVEKNYNKLKTITADLNGELEMYHSKISDIASSKKVLVKEKDTRDYEIGSMKSDLEKAKEEIQKLNEYREELASKLNYKQIEIEDEKSQINYLKGRLEEEKVRYLQLEEVLEEFQRSDCDADVLRNQLIAIKEESSNHITRITLLEREKYILSGKYDAAKHKEKELRKRLHDLQEKLEQCEKKLKDQKKVYEEQEAQQMKLIDLLKEQNSQNAKKKKPFLTINSKIVGEEGSKALRAEQDKNRRMNDEFDELKKDYDKTLHEVRQLKTQLVELHGSRDRALFSDMPCKFNHNFDIVQIEHSLFRKCFKCGKKLHKSARKCQSCGIMSHVDCKIETGTCGVASQTFQAEVDTTPINSDGSTTSGSTRNLYFHRPSAPNHSESEDDENEDSAFDQKLKKMQDKFYAENNLSPSKRKSTKSAKRNRPSPEKFSFSDDCFKDILE